VRVCALSCSYELENGDRLDRYEGKSMMIGYCCKKQQTFPSHRKSMKDFYFQNKQIM